MTERPIIFSGPMVRAILDGRKTQTRRVVKPQPAVPPNRYIEVASDDGRYWAPAYGSDDTPGGEDTYVSCPYGTVGDRLWVREAFFHEPPEYEYVCVHDGVSIPVAETCGEVLAYRADDEIDGIRWRPPIFMPRWASRITLRIESVRCERLQSIQLYECAEEGAPPTHPDDGVWDSTETFAAMWDTINRKRHPWASNPWVWAITFKRETP